MSGMKHNLPATLNVYADLDLLGNLWKGLSSIYLSDDVRYLGSLRVILEFIPFYIVSKAVEIYKALISPGAGKLLMLVWNMWSTTVIKWLI